MTFKKLTNEETAWAVLEPLWQECVSMYVKAEHREPKRVQVIVTPDMHDSCRHFAATDGDIVWFAPELVDLPVGTVVAVMCHELGHVVDLNNPGRYWFMNEELRRLDELPSKGMRKLIQRWRDRDDDQVEFVADAIAEQVAGVRIGYVGCSGCLVQSLARGIDRPVGLR